jgi:hypothetical protein
MSELNKFLKVMSKMGYPNPNTKSIARSMDYDLDEFLLDLVEEVGKERAEEFTENALSKLSEDGKGIKVPLNDNTEYIYLQIYESRIDLDETESQVLINWVGVIVNYYLRMKMVTTLIKQCPKYMMMLEWVNGVNGMKWLTQSKMSVMILS